MRVYMKYAYGMRVYMKYAYGMVCVHMPLACVCINKVCPHCMPKNADLGFLITCLGLVKFSFYMFDIRVNRITCFTCFIC